MADSSLTVFDKKLVDSAEMLIFNNPDEDIAFQFPPRITSDTNSSAWEEIDAWSIEMIRIHKGSVGRRINVEWEYIATDSFFTPKNISYYLRTLKQYFFKFERGVYPIVMFRYGYQVPMETFFRLRDLNITHGPEYIIGDNINGADKIPYPLYTKVNVTLELATNGEAGETAVNSATKGSDVEKIKQPPLRKVPPEWY